MLNRSEKSAEVVVVRDWADEAETSGEGPNEKECLRSCRCKTECVRCPGNWGGWGLRAVKLRKYLSATNRSRQPRTMNEAQSTDEQGKHHFRMPWDFLEY